MHSEGPAPPDHSWVEREASKGKVFLELVQALELWHTRPLEMASAERELARTGIKAAGECQLQRRESG